MHSSDTSIPTRFVHSVSTFAAGLHEPDMRPERIPESVIQDIWQHLRFTRQPLHTHTGQPLAIRNVGTLNQDQGPDFLAARLRIDEMDWVGDVEIHRTSADWFAHGHHEDRRYNSVILHVTLLEDESTGSLVRKDGSILPELVLYPLLDASLRQLLYRFYTSPRVGFPCASMWSEVPVSIRRSCVEALALERIREKRNRIQESYLKRPDLDQVLYRLIFRSMGYSKNSDAMQTLAERVPLDVARTYESPLDLEALYLGVAGLIPDLKPDLEPFVYQLRDRFLQIQSIHRLPVMSGPTWLFFRLRPSNFPTLRIAQSIQFLRPGGLLHHDPTGRLMAALGTVHPLSALRRILQVDPSAFWQSHVRLNQPTVRTQTGRIGRRRLDVVLTNAVLPVLMFQAEQSEDPVVETEVLNLLKQLPHAPDEITRRYSLDFIEKPGALHTQGLHQLYRTRCSQGACVTCPVGRFLLDRVDNRDTPG